MGVLPKRLLSIADESNWVQWIIAVTGEELIVRFAVPARFLTNSRASETPLREIALGSAKTALAAGRKTVRASIIRMFWMAAIK